jgi:hypothetical protein
MNVLAIVIAVAAAAIVLSIYYAPPVLGNTWSAAVTGWTGQTQEHLAGDLPRRMGLWILSAVVNAILLSWLINRLGVTELSDGLTLGAAVWAGFGATFSGWPVFFANQPWLLWVINNAAFLIIQLLMAGILTAMA